MTLNERPTMPEEAPQRSESAELHGTYAAALDKDEFATERREEIIEALSWWEDSDGRIGYDRARDRLDAFTVEALETAGRKAAERLAVELHRYVCGTDYDVWNNPCSWASEDTEPSLKSYPVCCDVDLSDMAKALADRVFRPGRQSGGDDRG